MKTDDLKKYDQAIFDAVLNTVSDGITVINKNLEVIFQNEAMCQHFGNQIGEYCYKAYRGREEACDDCIVLKVLMDGKSRKALRDVQMPDGNILWAEYFSGPFKDENGNIIGAVEVVRDVTEQIRITKECVTLRREVQRRFQFGNIITQSKKMKDIFRLIERIASTNSTVMISGESGTGKELIAKSIVYHSDRNEKPFVTVNCGAIPENLIESELFGHVKGSFTGAIKDHQGLIETAHGGTLFLDEVGEIPLSLQVKLLRFLQEGELRRVGETRVQKFDVRIISATNRNLEEAVKDGVFREDLLFRLSVIPIYLPPLRERREDIALLATHLLQRLCDTHNRKVTGISSETLKKLMDYPWRGNVRELENTIEYALHLTDDGQAIKNEQLPNKFSSNTENSGIIRDFISIDDYTKQTIIALQNNHTEEQIAATLGISRKNLWEKRKRWDITRVKTTN